MSDEKKTVELKDEDLEKVTGGDWHCPDIGNRDNVPKEQMQEGDRERINITIPTHGPRGSGKLS